MSDVGIGVSADCSAENSQFKHVFQHPVAGARVFVGHLTTPSNDPYLREVSTNSWAVFQGVGEPEVNPLMPSLTRQTLGLWVCEDEAVAKEIYKALNAGKELGFRPFMGDTASIMMMENNRRTKYIIGE